MEIVAAGNSRGQANVFTDMKIKMKDSTIQVRGFAPIGMLGLWNIGHPVKLFCAIIGSGLPSGLMAYGLEAGSQGLRLGENNGFRESIRINSY